MPSSLLLFARVRDPNHFLITLSLCSDNNDCIYRVYLGHNAACAADGNPYSAVEGFVLVNNVVEGGNFFGYMLLGVFLYFVLMYIYNFGDEKGWWDPIKDRLPTFTIPIVNWTFNPKSGGVFKSANKGASAATPMASSGGYGST